MIESDETYQKVLRYLDGMNLISSDELMNVFNIQHANVMLILETLESKKITTFESLNNQTAFYTIDNIALINEIEKTKSLTITREIELDEIEPDITSAKESGFFSSFIVFLVLFLIMLILFVSCSGNSPVQKIDYCSDEQSAYLNSKNFIINSLKSPSTAELPHYTEVSIINGESCTFRINGYVDAQNSFGATIRSKYNMTVQYNESKDAYILKNITFD